MHRIVPLLIVLFTYLALSESVGLPNLVLGILIAFVIIGSLHPRRRAVKWRRLPRAFRSLMVYLLIMIRNMIVSGVQVARLVLHPGLPLRSGIVAVPPECDSETGRALAAHAISLAPGELLIETAEDGTMYIHSLDVDETEKLIAASQRHRRQLLQNIFD